MSIRSVVRFTALLLMVLLAALLGLIVSFMYIEPNQFRDEIESIAKRNGYQVDLRGELSWGFNPDIQLVANDVFIARTKESSEFQADVAQLAFSLKPLDAFRGNLAFSGIEVRDADIEIKINDVSDDSDNSEMRLKEISESLPKTVVETFSLTDVRLVFATGEQSEQHIYINQLLATDLRTDGMPTGYEASVEISSSAGVRSRLNAKGFLVIDAKKKEYAVDASHLTIQHPGKAHIDSKDNEQALGLNLEGFLRARLDTVANRLSFEGELSGAEMLGVNGNFNGDLSPLRGSGRFQLNISDAQRLMEVFGMEVQNSQDKLHLLAAESQIDIRDGVLALNNLRMRVDGNPAKGTVRVPLGDLDAERNKQFFADLSFQKLNLDNYRKTDSQDSDSSNTFQSSDVTQRLKQWLSESSNPFEVSLSAEKLIWSNREIEDIQLKAVSIDTGFALNIDRARMAGGHINASINQPIDVSQPLVFSIDVLDIDLAEMSEAEANAGQESSPAILGNLTFSFDGNLAASSSPAILGLNGTGFAQLRDLVIPSLNLEQNLCESAELLGGSSAVRDVWEQGTNLGDVDIGYIVENGIAHFGNFQFQYGNMNTAGSGKLALENLAYDLNFSVAVNGERTSEEGCRVNKLLRGAQLPMQCSGFLDSETTGDCGIDSEVIEKMLVQELGGKLIDGILGKLISDSQLETEKSADNSTEKQDDGRSRKDEVRSILEGLLENID